MYRLRRASTFRVVRIGYRPRDVPIPPDGTDSIDVAHVAHSIAARAVTASTKRICPGEKSGGSALDLWEQARVGTAGRASSRAKRGRRTFVSAPSGAPSIRFDGDCSTIPWPSRTSESITRTLRRVRRGPSRPKATCARSFDGSREYFAPDDAVLLDPSFAETHCHARRRRRRARIRRRSASASTPCRDGGSRHARRRHRRSLDRSRETRAPFIRVSLHATSSRYAKGSGGEIHFALMPNGAPMIDHWIIHSAIIATDEDVGIERHPAAVRCRAPMRTNVRLLARQDIGGEIAFIDWADGTKWNAEPAAIHRVSSSTSRALASPARASGYCGTGDTAITAADGTFRLPYMFPGNVRRPRVRQRRSRRSASLARCAPGRSTVRARQLGCVADATTRDRTILPLRAVPQSRTSRAPAYSSRDGEQRQWNARGRTRASTSKRGRRSSSATR